MDLSIIIPGIRTNNWEELIESIKLSCSLYSYEVIFIGPEYDNVLDDYKNIKFVKDYGSPNRCQQIGMVLAEGDNVTWGSDDCMYEPKSIDKCLHLLEKDCTDVVITNYNEGGSKAVNNFGLGVCYPSTKHIKDSWMIFNTAFMSRENFNKVGGFDCSFDVTCVGHADFAARCQKFGYNVKLCDIKLLACSHMPGVTGDHAPVHYAQLTKDIPNYRNKYSKDLFPDIVVAVDNWKLQEEIWNRRFND